MKFHDAERVHLAARLERVIVVVFVALSHPATMLTKNPKGFEGSIKSPEPAVDAVRSAVAIHVARRRWLLRYGMKLFDLGGYGKEPSATVVSTTNQNLAAYATLSEDKTISVTLINKTHGPKAKEETVQIKLDKSLADSKVQVIFLRGRNDDIGGGSADVTLGGAQIKEDGTWSGQWTQLPPSAASDNMIVVTMPPASAAVVKAVNRVGAGRF